MLGPCYTKVDKLQPLPSGSSESYKEDGPGDTPGQENTSGMKEMAAGFAGLEGTTMEATVVIPERCLWPG